MPFSHWILPPSDGYIDEVVVGQQVGEVGIAAVQFEDHRVGAIGLDAVTRFDRTPLAGDLESGPMW